MQSDTLFGHLCWQVAFSQGSYELENWLAPFREGRPFFVLSDAFPAGLLPKPLSSAQMRLLPENSGGSRISTYDNLKKLNKAQFLTIDDFRLFCESANTQPKEYVTDPWRTTRTPHAAINRISSTTAGDTSFGGLYETTEKYLSVMDNRKKDAKTELIEKSGSEVDVYMRAQQNREGEVLKLLELVGVSGFGKDKSVGFGRFAVKTMEKTMDLRSAESPDGFVNLSTYVPAASDPTDGFWRLRIKYGRLGENVGDGNPFKKPLVQIEPGAIFRAKDQPPQIWLGRMVPSLSPSFPQAVQCGYALTCPCKLPAE
jgi:CRISPR-associated protein Csm4